MAPKKRNRSRSSAGSKKGKGQKTQSPTPQEKPGHPDDIAPLVLTSATQELFDCCADVDVTRESPYKLLKKDDIIQDMKTRAAVSDFSPVKQSVLDYPEEEMLLVFDCDFTYGQCFYLVLTPEKKNEILEPPEPETLEVSENEVNKTPEPKPWISLGSEQEIDEESVKDTREKLTIKFSRVRRKFGRPLCITDRNASDSKTSYLEIASYPQNKFRTKQMRRDCGIQAAPSQQCSSAQTIWKIQKNASTQYRPRELSKEEIESIMNLESLKDFLITITPRMMHALQQEEIMNVFIDDLKALDTGDEAGDWSGQVAEGLRLYQAFTDQKYTKGKKISSVVWHPTIHGVIAAALMEKREEPLDVSASRPAFIVFFSFSDPSNPQFLLECPDDILAFQFCPSNPNIIVGGCMNGQVVLWDVTAHITHLQENQPSSKMTSINTDTFDPDDKKEKKIPVLRFSAVSVIESSHKAPITDAQWLPPTFQVTRTGLPVENQLKLSAQIVTCSPDCIIMFWDVRLPKQLGQSLSDRKKPADQKTPITTCGVPETFKHLERAWKPLFRVSVSKIDTSGAYVPLKFSLEHYTSNDNTETSAENGLAETIPDYNQLTIPTASTVKILEDVNTKFYIGTEDGEIVCADWKVEKDTSGLLISAKALKCFSAHQYLVNTMQRSPFFKDIILTIGNWNFAIWRDGVMDGPLVLSQHSEQECTTGCWSLSRPAVFFIGKGDGSIEVWNMIENTSRPAHVHPHFTSGKITCIRPWTASSKQHFLAVADNLGVLRIFKIPQNLYLPSKDETLTMKKYFEREREFLKDYFKRKEFWVTQKKEGEELKKKKEEDNSNKSLQNIEEEGVKQYNADTRMAENILKGMGLWPAASNPQET